MMMMRLPFAMQWPRPLSPATSTITHRQILMMGGGPRTFPGGVSKWQWKKMQDKKAKQILKARLVRERQLYEMRKRAELKSADLHKPWENNSTAPTLFSVTADDQLKAMADRFVKRGAVDLWTDRDGPNSQFITVDGKPSVRVFPKDALHSTQPYTRYTPPRPSPPPPHQQQQQQLSSNYSKPRRGKSQPHTRFNNLKDHGPNPSMVAHSISALSSNSGQGNYNYAPKTKANQKLKTSIVAHSISALSSSSRKGNYNHPPKIKANHKLKPSTVSHSLSALSSNSEQGNYNYPSKTKENHNLKSAKDLAQQGDRFKNHEEVYGTDSPDFAIEPLYADREDYSYKRKVPIPESGMQTFAGFNLAKHSRQRFREPSYKSRMDAHSRPHSNSRASAA